MERIPTLIRNASCRLFWDIDPTTLDPVLHEDFIFERVLSKGDWSVVRALRAEVGDGALRVFLERAPHRLDARTRRFLEVVLPKGSEEPCTPVSFRRNNDALFRP